MKIIENNKNYRKKKRIVYNKNTITNNNASSFEATMKEYLQQGQEKLISDLTGTREAIKLIAKDKTKDFMLITDRGLDKKERDFLIEVIVSSMHQTFCYGYGIGKIEGQTNNRVFL